MSVLLYRGCGSVGEPIRGRSAFGVLTRASDDLPITPKKEIQKMQVSFTGIVREIKDWETDKQGNVLPPEKVTTQITFLDRETGGDVVITFPHDHGFVVGQDVQIKNALVKPVLRNFKLSLYAQPNNTPVHQVDDKSKK